jgi:hypothetical protein
MNFEAADYALSRQHQEPDDFRERTHSTRFGAKRVFKREPVVSPACAANHKPREQNSLKAEQRA